MKKVKIASILLSFVFLCNSCELLNQLTCNHQYKVISEESATCSSNGKITKECELCQKVVTEKTDKLPHNYKSEVVKPDCVNQGYTNNVCLDCGHNEKNNYVDALGHDFSDWVIVQQPNEVTDGIKERVCACGEKETQTLPSGHNFTNYGICLDCNYGWVNINLPETPLTVKSALGSFKIEEMRYELGRYDSGYLVRIFYSGTQTYCYSNTNNVLFDYKILDSKGYIVTSGYKTTPIMSVGDKIKDASFDIKYIDLDPNETYTLIISGRE